MITKIQSGRDSKNAYIGRSNIMRPGCAVSHPASALNNPHAGRSSGKCSRRAAEADGQIGLSVDKDYADVARPD